MNEELFIHTLSTGADRSTMIRKITEQLNGDQDVLVEGWENLPTEDLIELYSNLVEDVA